MSKRNELKPTPMIEGGEKGDRRVEEGMHRRLRRNGQKGRSSPTDKVPLPKREVKYNIPEATAVRRANQWTVRRTGSRVSSGFEPLLALPL